MVGVEVGVGVEVKVKVTVTPTAALRAPMGRTKRTVLVVALKTTKERTGISIVKSGWRIARDMQFRSLERPSFVETPEQSKGDGGQPDW